MTTTPTKLPYPETTIRPVNDTYHGVDVADPYRWLEDGDNGQVRQWTAAQNTFTRSILDQYDYREDIAADLTRFYSEALPNYYSLVHLDGYVFAMKQQPPLSQPLLVRLDKSLTPENEKIILDPNKLNEAGTTTIDFFDVSHDGRLVAISLSEAGSEDGTLHIYEVETGRELGDLIPRVTYPTGGGSVAWNEDNSGLFYTRYPAAGERPPEDFAFYQQIYFHRLGDDIAADSYQLGEDFPRIAEIVLRSDAHGRNLVAIVANGDGGEFTHFLRRPDGDWQQLTQFADEYATARFGRDGALYFLSRKGTPRGAIVRLALDAATMAASEVVVPQTDAVIQDFRISDNRIYVNEMLGGPAQIRVYSLSGQDEGVLAIEPISAVFQILVLEGDKILYLSTSYVSPMAWYQFDPADEEPQITPLRTSTPLDTSKLVVNRVLATAPDGTRVPLNIVHRPDVKLDGTNPTLLYGYGGYGITLPPVYMLRYHYWVLQGGVLVIANLRGGGEFGEEWHKAGNLTRKQNVFDDFLAGAQYLIETGYTNADRLAIEGGSNGGLLMGAAFTQRPDLFRAVVSYVGVYDMLRVELDPNGAYNVTEFGTVTRKDHFDALYAYSPYHNIRDGVAYPAILISTGENDGRVNPAHSRKMAARLQAATISDRPILLRTDANAGHGIGTAFADRVALETDVFAFLFAQLGMTYAPVEDSAA